MNKAINGNIELLRYLFTIAVAVMHVWYVFYGSTFYLEGAYLAVDFFFILSGFYLAKKVSISYESAWTYTISRYIKMAFVYISSILVCCAVSSNLHSFVIRTIRAIPDILCLQSSGIFYPTVNVIIWYISAMLIVGFFIVSMINLNENIYRTILAPFFIIIGYALVYHYFGCLDVTTNHTGYILPISLCRAIAGMSMGYLVKHICDKIDSFSDCQIGSYRIYVIVSLLLSLLMMIYSFLHAHTVYSFMFLIGAPFVILCCNSLKINMLCKFMGGG